MKNRIYIGMVCLLATLFAACSDHEEEDPKPVADEITEPTRSTAVEASITLTEAGTLDASLATAVGEDDKYNVTKLTLSGPFNAADVVTLHKLTALSELDMTEVSIVGEGSEEDRYEFTATLWYNTQTISEYLYQNTLGSYMFAGMTNLVKVTLPKTVTIIYYGVFHSCTALETIVLPETLTNISSSDVFSNTSLLELTVPASVTEVSENFAYGCSTLKAIYWNSTAKVPYCDNMGNVFLYLYNTEAVASSSWKNVIINGEAESITLQAKDPWTSEDNLSLVAPKAFTAKKISYTRYFNSGTGIGYSAGWETIVLPFVPTSITHESKGTIAPFNSEVEDAKPFWLRALTADGFVDVTAMEANVPYIIAMPNNDRYSEEYRLYGWVTFSGENVEIPESVTNLDAVAGPTFSLQPTYEPVEESNYIYTMNIRYSNGYNNGSVFIRGGGDVRAFEAYATLDGRSARSVLDLDCSSSSTRAADQPNTSGIPEVGDM